MAKEFLKFTWISTVHKNAYTVLGGACGVVVIVKGNEPNTLS